MAHVTVTTTATTIATGVRGDSSAKVALLITLPTTATEAVYLEIRDITGVANTPATVADGYSLAVGQTIGLELLPGDTLTGIVATTDQTLDVLRSG